MVVEWDHMGYWEMFTHRYMYDNLQIHFIEWIFFGIVIVGLYFNFVNNIECIRMCLYVCRFIQIICDNNNNNNNNM